MFASGRGCRTINVRLSGSLGRLLFGSARFQNHNAVLIETLYHTLMNVVRFLVMPVVVNFKTIIDSFVLEGRYVDQRIVYAGLYVSLELLIVDLGTLGK